MCVRKVWRRRRGALWAPVCLLGETAAFRSLKRSPVQRRGDADYLSIQDLQQL